MLDLDLKQTLNKVWIDALLMDIPLDERYKIKTHPTHPTACWTWRDTPKPGENKIFVGEKCVELATVQPADEIFIQSLLYHELSHSLWTDRDIKGTQEWCSANKVPFRLYNLFEDARIENSFRKRFGRKFFWTDYMQLPFNEDTKAEEITPESVFNAMTTVEGAKLYDLPSDYEYGKRIREYFDRVLLCESSEDLKPILLEWCAEFPQPEDDENTGEGGDESVPGSSDIINSETAEQMESESSDAVEYGFDGSDRTIIETKVGSTPVKEFTFGQIHDPLERGDIFTEFKKYIPLMSKIFQDKKGYLSTESPAKRLNVRGLTGTSDKIYRKKSVKKSAKRTVNLIIDCSGSMGGLPIKGARTYAMLLNELAKIGKIDGHLILSAAYGKGATETFKLPVDEDVIYGIPANGNAENIFGTIQRTKRILKAADYNFFYTDGQITDSAIDKQKLRSEGIYTFGMYVGKFENSQLSMWFDRDIVRESFEELVNELVRRIK